MYNRYIPQNDGSYRKRTVPEPPRGYPPKSEAPPFMPPPPPPRGQPPRQAGSFLKSLLPVGLDTEDLLILVLLLLMSGDCREDNQLPLLTLALYLLL